MSEKYYMLGVCGMGMAPLASFLKDGGADVQGFDDCPNIQLKTKLENCGIVFAPLHKIEPDRKIIISTALKRRTEEIAKETGCNNISRRGECWSKICATRKLTAIVGSHGKSTVSALLAHCIIKNKKDSGYLVGAIPSNFPMHKYCPDGKPLISEIDESDGTIENFSPEVCVALNADLDHTDTYADTQKLEEMFERLFARTKKIVIYPENDEILSRVAKRSKTPSRAVKVDGGFMQINRAMAKIAYEETFGETLDDNAFDDFCGLMRRQEIICNTPKLRAIADYAHHPNEVMSFLDWFAENFDGEKIILFQPHRYTRTRKFADDFAKILDSHATSNSRVLLLPVYPASEPFDPLGESDVISVKSARIMLAKPEDFFKIITDKLNDKNTQKINVAIVGAGDFYFPAKEFFSTIK